MNFSKIRVNSSRPLYKQIKHVLLSAIVNQEILPGEKIPSLDTLCKHYNVSRMTARQAVQELVHEGKLYTVIGKGTFVSIPEKIEPTMNTIWGFSDSFSKTGDSHLSRLLSLEIQKSGSFIAEKLNISPENKIYKLSRLRLINQQPVAVESSHLPYHRFPNLEKFDWNNVSLYETLRNNYHAKLSKGKQTVEAACATNEIAALLEVRVNSPMLIMDRVIMCDAGWNVEYAYAYYRADRIRLSINMSDNESITLVKAVSSE